MRRATIAAIIVGLILTVALAQGEQPNCADDRACVYVPIVAKADAPTATPTRTATPTATPTERAGLSKFKNPGFEDGHVAWIEIPDHGVILIAAPFSGLTPHTGQWLAHLGGENDSRDEVQQTITLPAAPVYLHYYRQINTQDVVGIDTFQVLVNAAVVEDVTLGPTEDTGGQWVEDVLDVSAYARQIVTIRFFIYLDDSDPGDVYLDDISLSSHS